MAGSTQELERFVYASLERGQSREAIESVLAGAGWAPEQIRLAMAGYAESDFPIPVPRPRPFLSAREAFVYAVIFTTLFLSAYHLGSLLFSLIDRVLPNPADGGYGYASAAADIRWSLAWVIIAFPVFLWLNSRNERELSAHPVKRQSAVRRWLTYLTLFVASLTLICDVVTLLAQFLGGEFTVRVVLKVLVAAVIGTSLFLYYFRELRQDEALR